MARIVPLVRDPFQPVLTVCSEKKRRKQCSSSFVPRQEYHHLCHSASASTIPAPSFQPSDRRRIRGLVIYYLPIESSRVIWPAKESSCKDWPVPLADLLAALANFFFQQGGQAGEASQELLVWSWIEKAGKSAKEGYLMTVVDFIDVIDDIIDLSSDEETVQEEHIATQPRATLLDRQAVFVLADGERQDAQAAFVSVGEGSQETTKYENAFVATTSPPVMEKAPLGTAESKNCPSFPTRAPLPSPTSTTLKTLTSEVGDTQLVTTASSPSVMEKMPLGTAESNKCPSSPASAPLPSPTCTTVKALTSEVGDAQLVNTASSSVMEKAPLGTAESNNCPSSPAPAPLPSPTSTTVKALTSEVGDAQLVTTASSSVKEKAPLDTAESENCPISQTSAPLPSPTSTTPKALTSEVGATKLARVRGPNKNYHTSTPRRSPRLRECCSTPVEELAANHKRSRLLEPAEESAAPTDNAESTKTHSADSAN